MQKTVLALCCAALLLAPWRAAYALNLGDALLDCILNEKWHAALATSGHEKTIRSYVRWRAYQDLSYDVPPHELTRFISQHPDWPKLNRIQLRAEKAFFQRGITSANQLKWFAKHPPISGYGMLAYARIAPSKQLIEKAWINGDFEAADEERILAEHHKHLSATIHRKRAERLLQQNKASIAKRLLNKVGKVHSLLYTARIAIARNERGLDAKIARIPKSLRADHGLLADRAKWRHKKGLAKGTRELLLQMHPNSPYADQLYRLRANYARDAIEAKSYKAAKALLSNAGTQLSAANKADALWLKGWLELSFLKQPRAAYQTFNALYDHVRYPVSRARGAYWSAKAAQKAGDEKAHSAWLQQAAKFPTAFYGQLAHAALHPNKPLTLPKAPNGTITSYRHYANLPLMQLAIALYKAKQDKLAAGLLNHVIAGAKHSSEFASLMRLCIDHALPYCQVRVAKLASRQNIILSAGWPLIAPPKESVLPASLALAIARQESEFNPIAVSHANARGMMQLLPSTARKTAKKLELNYSLSKLFEPQYNMRLGSRYLADLIDGFDGNYILAIAGYNAGPSRSRQWVKRFGWPDKNLEDTLTFLELIPFSETRNYVQRVLENAQIYQHLLKAETPLSLEQDLLR